MSEKRLVIKTDSYAGNFERELIGYVFGRLSDEQEEAGSAREYKRAFWLYYANVDNYEEYLEKEKNTVNFNALMAKADLLLGKEVIETEPTINMTNIYSDYLKFVVKEADDDYENTFYEISGNNIYVYLQQDLPEKFHKLFTERIKSFFSNRVYEVFENMIYLSRFDSLASCDTNINLLDLYYEEV